MNEKTHLKELSKLLKKDKEIQDLISKVIEGREYFRLKKDWKSADRIRKILEVHLGVYLKDYPDGVVITYKGNYQPCPSSGFVSKTLERN